MKIINPIFLFKAHLKPSQKGFTLVEALVTLAILGIAIGGITQLSVFGTSLIRSSQISFQASSIESKVISSFGAPINFSSTLAQDLKQGNNANFTGSPFLWPGLSTTDQVIGRVNQIVSFTKDGEPCASGSPECQIFSEISIKCFPVTDLGVTRSICFGAYRITYSNELSNFIAPMGVKTGPGNTFADSDYIIPLNLDYYMRSEIAKCNPGEILIGFDKYSGGVNGTNKPICIPGGIQGECKPPQYPTGVNITSTGIFLQCATLKTASCSYPFVAQTATFVNGNVTDISCVFPTQKSGPVCQSKLSPSGGTLKVCPLRFYAAKGSCGLDTTGSKPGVCYSYSIDNSTTPPTTKKVEYSCGPNFPNVSTSFHGGEFGKSFVTCSVGPMPSQPGGAVAVINSVNFYGSCTRMGPPE